MSCDIKEQFAHAERPMTTAYKPPSFLQYITRPSGFGRTQWIPAIIVHVAYTGMLVQRFWWNSVAAQFVFYFGLFLCFMFWIGTWRNWKVDRAGLPRHPNNHTLEVMDNDPMKLRDRFGNRLFSEAQMIQWGADCWGQDVTPSKSALDQWVKANKIP